MPILTKQNRDLRSNALILIIQNFAVGIIYFFAALLGLSLSFHHTNVSPVWPPAGIALTGVLLLGHRVCPGIFAAAFLANFWTEVPFLVSIGISVGNTLEAAVGALLVRQFIGPENPIGKVAGIFKFLIIGAICSLIAAIIGITSIYFGHSTHGVSVQYLLWTWWLGDTSGIFVVAPFLLAWIARPAVPWQRLQFLDCTLLLAMVGAIGVIIFGEWIPREIHFVYLIIPFVILVSYQFEQRGASAAILILAALAVWNTQRGTGPFSSENLNESLLFLQIFLMVISSTALILSAAVSENKSAGMALRSSESKYRTLSEQIPAITYISEFGAMGRWLYVGPQIQRLLGFSQEEWLSDPSLWIKQMHPEDQQRVLEEEEECRKQIRPLRMEYRIFAKDGNLVWVRDEGVPLMDTQSPQLYQGFLIDVTERRETEEALRQSQEKYKTLVDSIEGIVFESDAQTFQFSFVSKQAEKFLGYPVERWIQEPDFWTKHVHPDDRAWATDYCVKATQRGEDHEFEYRMIAADGRVVWLRDFVNVIQDNGHPRRLRGVMVDITEKKRAETLQAALYRIADITSAAEDIQEFYSALHKIIAELMYANNLYIALYDANTHIVSFPYFVDEIDSKPQPKQAGRGLTEYVLRTGRPLLVNPEKFRELIERKEVELVGEPSVDWLGIPLKTGEKTFGVLAVQSYSEKIRYGPREEEVLTFVSQHIATAFERKHGEEALRSSEERYRRFFEEDLTGDYICTPAGQILSCNPAFAHIFGFESVAEAMIHNFSDLYPTDEAHQSFVNLVREEKKLEYNESELRRHNGDPVYVIENAIGFFNKKGELERIQGYMFDNTERKKLEEQLRQAQKIKAIGQLAGGVAHDFNNTLMAITGYCDLLLMKLEAENPLRRHVSEIQKAADHGAALTRQLLAFSRKQIMAPKILDLNQVLDKMNEMLRRLIREDVELVMIPDAHLGRVQADPGQVEQVILNLAVNAREAMPTGGRITIQTTNTLLNETYAKDHVGVQPGWYVMLSVTDTGCGMDEITRTRIFEPFFTTKESGTGLGLSTVYGIVEQSGGHLTVQSELGRGSTFHVYLPRIDLPADRAAAPLPAMSSGQCRGTILLVDDNEAVRKAIGGVLQMRGYTVFQASHGLEALEISEAHKQNIDLLITDMVMPHMSGRELARRLTSQRPHVKVLYISGHSEEAVQEQGLLEMGSAFLAKPVPMQMMMSTIQDLIGS